MTAKKKLVLIDGNALVHRAFHAFAQANLTTPQGKPSGAIYGFASMLLNIFTKLKPDYIAVAFDTQAPTFRHEEYKEYKATRIKAPQELYDQIPAIQKLVETFNIPMFLKDGFEADDIIGTLSKQTPSSIETYIATGDMDALQLVDNDTFVYAPRKGFADIVVYDPAEVLKTKGLKPSQWVDFKGLRGDPSDNIPGVPGIGEVSARKLLIEYGSMEGIYKHIDKITGRTGDLLREHKQQALQSKGLATIRADVPIKLDLKKAEAVEFDANKVRDLFYELDFRSLIDKVPKGTLTTPPVGGHQASFFKSAQPREVKGAGQKDFIQKLDAKVEPVLRKMERAGIMVDLKRLHALNEQISARLKRLRSNIFKYSKKEFNISSPQQLAEFLFKTLKLPAQGLTKGKSGYSTAVSELEKIYSEHPVIKHILEYRQLEKLRNTYLETLPKLVDKQDRVHTTYAQDTSTGRLSSKDPNLQNIPIRSDLGAEIRKAFIAPKGFRLISADYSQIELRVVASLAHDKTMLGIFKKGKDIHTMTAAEVNGVKPKDVTPAMRRNAKVINFGIIYGVSAFGLAARTDMSVFQARRYIAKYFELYPKIKEYMDSVTAFVITTGYVETLFGRRRHLPEVKSRILAVRNASIRAAINMPIQGTAADIMKIAMVNIAKELPKISKDSKLLLQVHDEVVLEVPTKDVKKVAKLVKTQMESATKLAAPIEAKVEAGINWGGTKKV
ncbi:MAG: polymerase I protein [candidate division Kazan bacterium GW2011_GWA1_50_15]|uniref:DNA-directed DNA polymerase n=2 Tax=Bacteria division Kazan-3B-28 TaxID=1798534 RepID=A0A0G2A4Q3_UNCK3|nr:MAG: polymerase I protein [candidate division Kazan bacterium GW2011_GWA1_50_15]KKW25766.1 MAG: polymerase protein [candidate division Kazan bacterium GW2011_GWC1_52_13]KKW27219.1 MAG: polymerase protein [candidate division Kazan bacterium GW2011_GWB1_52_7]HCR42513.1 hypothetical protein [Patescibacteria group bacterium]